MFKLTVGICCLLLGISPLFAQEAAGAKKVVMIIAQNQFRDEELLQPKEILEKAGVVVKVASSSTSEAEGMLGAKVKPDFLISEVNINDYDAIVFVGGSGASEYWESPVAQKLAKDANSAGKIVAAICLAPLTLANAGILEGKKVTAWETQSQKLRDKGAFFTGRKVQKDGNLITASGPIAANEFGQAILEALSGKEKAQSNGY